MTNKCALKERKEKDYDGNSYRVCRYLYFLQGYWTTIKIILAMKTVSFPDFWRTSSPFGINVPTRSVLVLAKIDSFVILVTNLNNKKSEKKRCLSKDDAKTETTAQVDLKTGLTNRIAVNWVALGDTFDVATSFFKSVSCMKQELILSKATETLKTSVSLAKLYSFSACSLAVPTSKTYNIQGYISENIQ